MFRLNETIIKGLWAILEYQHQAQNNNNNNNFLDQVMIIYFEDVRIDCDSSIKQLSYK